MIKIKKYFDVKDIQIDREYYEKLKKVDYSKVEDELYGYLFVCNDILSSELNTKYEEEEMERLIFEEPEEFERIQEEIKEEIEYYGIEELDEDTKEYLNEISEKNFFPYPDIRLMMVVGAYVLLILQEPLSEKNFDSSIIENSNLSKEVQEIIIPYISDPCFKMQLFSLINKFEKDELLAFMVFSFSFDHYCKYQTKKEDSIYKSCDSLSDGLIKLFLNILDIKDNEEVLNLYSDLGDFLIASSLSNSSVTIYGSEDYFVRDKLSILKASLFSNNIKFENTDKENGIVFNDSDEENISTLKYFENRESRKVDKIFLNLSQISGYYKNNIKEVTEEYRSKLENNFKIPNEILKNASLEWIFHILLINQLKEKGKGISLIETNILYEPKNKNIRKYFVENGYIESIIYLPKNMLIDYPLPLALIVFSKENKKIKFIDAYKFCKMEKFKIEFIDNYFKNPKITEIKEQNINIIIDTNVEKIMDLINNQKNNKESFSKKIEDIVKKDYNLVVTENFEILLDIFKKFKNEIKFKDIIKNIIRGSQKTISKFKSEEETPYIYLSLSDINDGLIEFENIENYLKEIPKNQEKFFIKNNSILLSKYGSSPKLAIAQIPDNKKVIPSGNFIIIEVDEEKLNPWYLMSYFSSGFGSEKLKETYTEAKNDTISIRKLENIEIPVPPIKEQEKIGKQYRESLKKIEDMKKKLKNEIQNSKEIFIKYSGDLV